MWNENPSKRSFLLPSARFSRWMCQSRRVGLCYRNCEFLHLFCIAMRRGIQLAGMVFIVKFSVLAHSHRGSNFDREIVDWGGRLRLFALWNKRSSESEGENCGWRGNKAGALTIWLAVTWRRNGQEFGMCIDSENSTESFRQNTLRSDSKSGRPDSEHGYWYTKRLLLLSQHISLPAVSYQILIFTVWKQLKPSDVRMRQTGISCLEF